ncbi:MAG: hypothetical protein DWQ01_19715 [Planctomycetota bacterium]|nr:MAG: hypothetical protein DWQ01_19715 [Planctomycetota bacterium]
MRSRKHTAWRKNRKLGDVYGGRARPKLADQIFRRAHSLSPPGLDQQTPILIEDNPSRDYFFPLNGEECLQALKALPAGHTKGITHLWLKRQNPKGSPLAEFICGRGVHLVVMYSWRKDMNLWLGRRKPSGRVAKEYARFGAEPFYRKGGWHANFSLDNLRRYFVEVLFHEVGHHVDFFHRHWSKANVAEREEFADQYAMSFRPDGIQVLNHLMSQRDS